MPPTTSNLSERGVHDATEQGGFGVGRSGGAGKGEGSGGAETRYLRIGDLASCHAVHFFIMLNFLERIVEYVQQAREAMAGVGR